MSSMDLQERAESYSKRFPKYPKLFVDKDWLMGVWMIGNYYRNSSPLYGAYPHSYLERIMSLFPDCKDILHLFSGSLGKETKGLKFDLNSKTADINGDAEKLSSYFPKKRFDLIPGDPAYSKEDALHYGIPMINRKKVVSECYKILKPCGFLVWLDQVFPMFRKSEFKLVGTIGVIRSTNHRVRFAFVFKKK